MVKYRVTRIVEFAHEVEADTQEEALAAFDPGQATIRLVRERVKGERRGPEQGAIADRELRIGRAFRGKHKGRTFTATVLAADRIEVVDEEGHNLGSFKGLHAAAMAITEGSAINAWRFFKDVPAEGAEPEQPTPATPRKAKKSRKRATRKRAS